MEPFNSVRHNRPGRVYLMQAEALRMESLEDREECVDVCLPRDQAISSCW
jgi:hypothetical protein